MSILPFNRPRLLAPGPVETDPRIGLVLAQPQIHHRTPEARQIVLQARKNLNALLGAEGWEMLITTSSGTGAFEAALLALVPAGAPVLCAHAGKFGERWGIMAKQLGYQVHNVSTDWGKALSPQAVAAEAAGMAAIFITHSETATGVLHDLQAIVAAVRVVNPDILVLVDAITSYGVCELRPNEWQLDAVISGSQKAVAAPPGLGFVGLSPRAMELLGANPQRYYFDLKKELKSQQKGETAYTPAINLIAAVAYSTERLISVPLETLWAEKRRMNAALLAAGAAVGCAAFAEIPSPSCAALVPPAPFTGKQVAEALKAHGARAAAGQDPYKDAMFRISMMGYFDRYDALATAGILEDALASLGHTFQRGAAVQAAWAALQ